MFCSGDAATGLAVSARFSAAGGECRAGTRRGAARRWLPAIWAVTAAVCLLIAFPGLAQASIGVGVQGAPVRLRTVAQPGSSYALQPVYVVNTGTQDESINMRVQRLSGRPGRAVPASWIQFSGNGMQLPARESARIPLELVVPAGAAPGKYLSDVVVVGSASIAVGKTNLGVAAATKLEFSVGQGSAPGLAFPPWMLWTLGGLLLAAAVMLAFRRSGLQVQVVRRPVSNGFADRERGYRGG
jgi:hypothetical protein